VGPAPQISTLVCSMLELMALEWSKSTLRQVVVAV
jgi:hypothetical protein